MPVAAWMIDALDPQPGHSLIELAAGTGDTGLLAAELVEPGGEVIISDFSPEMLAVARRRADELHVTNVRFKQIDAETSIDIPAASLDGALCRWGYPLMADPENALRETRRVLKPGARLALAGWAARRGEPVERAAERACSSARGLAPPADPEAPGQFAAARPGLLEEQLAAAGFSEHHVERARLHDPLRLRRGLVRRASRPVGPLRERARAGRATRTSRPSGRRSPPPPSASRARRARSPCRRATWVAWAAA